MKKTYYEVLGVDPDCTIDEIKKSYKRLALKFHPDKNLDNLEESKVIFTEIKDAYEVLSDATERAWYDRHKDAFHDEEEHHNDIETQLDAFLDAARYRKFNDTPDGFYMVMSRLFEAIVNQEGAEELAKAMGDEIPEFGSSTTDPGEAKRFYDFWCAFQTSIKFTSLNKYDIREAENRRVLRLMEKENAKIRDKARKDRNKKIQKFVSYIRTKDPRILAFKKQTEERVAANRLKTKANRQRKLAEQRKQMENHVEQDWNSLKGLEREIQQIEADLENFNEGSKKSRKNRKKKKNNRVSSDEEEEEEEEEEDEGEEEPASEAASVPEQQQQTNGTTDAQNGQTPVADDLSDDDHVDIAELNASGCYCAPCRKTFKTGGAFRSHVQSKKHLERVAYLAKISVTFGDNP